MAACICIWKQLLVLLLFAAPWPSILAQSDIYIACGSRTILDIDGAHWIPPDNYVKTGKVASVPNIPPGGILSGLRYFPEGRKNCFQIGDLQSGTRYLVRARFLYGRYDMKTEPPQFGVAIDATYVHRVDLQESWPSLDVQLLELILTPATSNLSYCLIAESGNPVISTLEFRPLPPDVYSSFDGRRVYKLVQRVDTGGGTADLRDQFDRSWENDTAAVDTSSIITNTSLMLPGNITNDVPIGVLESARTINSSQGRMDFNYTVDPNSELVALLYFAELSGTAGSGERIFDIFANGKVQVENLDLVNTTITTEQLWIFPEDTAGGSLNISLAVASGSQGPILNALEVYEVLQMAVTTQQDDVEALMAFSTAALLGSFSSFWSGDPCLPSSTGWDGVTCSLATDPPRITALNLTGKAIWGPLPTSLAYLIHLEDLSLGNNFFSGPIPPGFSNLSSLKYLELQHNQLNGVLPEYLFDFPDLKIIFLQNNNFSGMIRKSIIQNLKERNVVFDFSGNPYLEPEFGSHSGTRFKIFLGGGLSLGFVVALSVIVYSVYKRRMERSYKSPPTYQTNMKPLGEPLELEWLSVEVQQYSLRDVELATSNYKNMIGEGGFGAVYYGTLGHGQAVAVKVRSSSSHQGTREFYAEINLLKRLRHENLVPLLGSCSEGDCQILIYPYMSNGSLQDRLWGEAARRKPLDWATRLTIALGAARGLYFLHTGGERCIIHRDVKSSNILLDHRMVAKVADFGLSKYAPQEGDSLVSMEVRGTAGYLDPEYYSTQQLTEKSDVFSFGVVLLEIICGREPLNIHRPRPEWSLVEWIRPFIRESRLQDVVDPTILGSYTCEAMWRVLEIAICSVEPHAIHRPAMADIIRELEDALIIENNASQYMASVQSLDSVSMSASDIKMPPPTFPFEPSPVFSETMDSPDPR